MNLKLNLYFESEHINFSILYVFETQSGLKAIMLTIFIRSEFKSDLHRPLWMVRKFTTKNIF